MAKSSAIRNMWMHDSPRQGRDNKPVKVKEVKKPPIIRALYIVIVEKEKYHSSAHMAASLAHTKVSKDFNVSDQSTLIINVDDPLSLIQTSLDRHLESFRIKPNRAFIIRGKSVMKCQIEHVDNVIRTVESYLNDLSMLHNEITP